MEFELELYNRYLAGCDEDEEVLSFESGFDPYCGCYTWDC